jgi:formate dehydrogenase beta subunit
MGLPGAHPGPRIHPLIAQGRYDDAYMVNWVSQRLPRRARPHLRPALRARLPPWPRRGENLAKPEPVAICRLKRVAADFKGGEVRAMMPRPQPRNGKRVACVGAGPASLTVARDLACRAMRSPCSTARRRPAASCAPRSRASACPSGDRRGGRLHPRLGVEFRSGQRIDSMKALLAEGYDAVFVGCGAPRGRDLDIPGRREAAAHIHIGIDWLASVSFGHVTSVGKRVIVLGGGNTAMDCCRSRAAWAATTSRSSCARGFEEMKASPWEKEDAQHEGIPILNYHVPKAFLHAAALTGMRFEIVRSGDTTPRAGAAWCPPASPTWSFPATRC